jgi:hypothetical protein
MAFPGYKDLGVSLLNALTAAQVSDTTLGKEPALIHKLGTRVSDDEGNEYVWVQANGAIAVGDIVKIAAGYDVAKASAAADQPAWGVGIVAIEDNGQGFVQVKGVVTADLETGVLLGDILARNTGSSGYLEAVDTGASANSGDRAVFGVALAAESSNSGSIYIY